MAKFLTLAAVYLRTPDHAARRRIEAGQVVSFDGVPSAMLHPLDTVARERSASVEATYSPEAASRRALAAHRAMARLTSSARAIADASDAARATRATEPTNILSAG